MKKARFDWVGMLAILLLLISLSLFTYYYSVKTFHSCTSNPIEYGVKELIDQGYNYSYISVNVYLDEYSVIPLRTFKFVDGRLQPNDFLRHNPLPELPSSVLK